MLGLGAEGIEVMLCGNATGSGSPPRQQERGEAAGQGQEGGHEETIPWSDHAGLKCAFGLV